MKTLYRAALPAVAFLMVASIGTPPPARGDEPATVREITVQGTASVMAVPDRAEATAGVVTRALTAAEAVERNSATVEKLMAALSASGISSRDIRTSGFSISPQLERREPGGAARRIVGYRVANQVSVTVRRIDRLGALLDAMIGAGANRISGIRLSIGTPKKFADEASRRAMADARRKAGLLAEASGVRVGRVLRIVQQAGGGVRPVFLQAAAVRASIPIAPGEQTVTASVTVTYEIE